MFTHPGRLVDGPQVVYDQVIDALQQTDRPLLSDVKDGLLQCVMDVLEKYLPQLELWPSGDVRTLLSDLYSSNNADYLKTADKFVARFTVCESTTIFRITKN